MYMHTSPRIACYLPVYKSWPVTTHEFRVTDETNSVSYITGYISDIAVQSTSLISCLGNYYVAYETTTGKPVTLNEVLYFSFVYAGSYSKTRNVRHLQNQILAEYVNFPDIRITYLLPTLVYLTTLWICLMFVTWYAVLYHTHVFHFLFVADYLMLQT